jgi:hypothetical protein
MSSRLSPLVWASAAVLVLVATGLPVYLVKVQKQARAVDTRSPGARLQHELLVQALALPSDPDLEESYARLNAKHFDGELPAMPVRWEPRLAEVDALEGGDAQLKGMFGTLNGKAAILISPSVGGDDGALTRALCHEMAHAYMFRMGEDTRQHGPSYQAVLRRLSIEGAFEGLASTPEERDALRRWIDREKTRLAAEDAALRQTVDPERLERLRTDRARVNAEIDRYNLMLLFPDGR